MDAVGQRERGPRRDQEREAGGPGAWGEVAKLTARDAAAFDAFGASVAIEGDTAVVGAVGDGDAGVLSGSAYIFARAAGDPGAWQQIAKLTADDATAGDRFGASVAIAGDTVIVGAQGSDGAGTASGAAYVFAREAGGPGGWGQVAKLTAADAAPGDQFGASVAIQGDTVLVGAGGDDDAGSGSGSAYLFAPGEGGSRAWRQIAKLAAADGSAFDGFGRAVALGRELVTIGAPDDDAAGERAGSAYVFRTPLEPPARAIRPLEAAHPGAPLLTDLLLVSSSLSLLGAESR